MSKIDKPTTVAGQILDKFGVRGVFECWKGKEGSQENRPKIAEEQVKSYLLFTFFDFFFGVASEKHRNLPIPFLLIYRGSRIDYKMNLIHNVQTRRTVT